MNELIEQIRNLMNSNIAVKINRRLNEFKMFKNATSHDLFEELCFCILTANCSAESCINVQKNAGKKFRTLTREEDFSRLLKENGYRFYNVRAKYIADAVKYRDEIKDILKKHGDDFTLRDWLAKNIMGLGYKEASHFLRNIGHENLAIIDFHIVDILERNGLIKKPKTMTKKKYLEIEEVLATIAEKLNISLAALDLYLWFIETGKILK
ncbi:MAG: N-glycosylase/DNA lyase [Promethearchaeota archaeon]